jgi:hypothetical protein
MPIEAAQLKAIQERFRAGEVGNAQGMLLDLQHQAEQEELQAQIAAGNPPPAPTAEESILALLSEIVTHLGSPAKLVTHLANIKAAPAIAAIAAASTALEPANSESEHHDEAHA